MVAGVMNVLVVLDLFVLSSFLVSIAHVVSRGKNME